MNKSLNNNESTDGKRKKSKKWLISSDLSFGYLRADLELYLTTFLPSSSNPFERQT